ncbi:hypothetical protein L6452_41890 [Arctium lappa]|uniref:Uncharacterized protein n=1 Tax=Arctium lappa TaxID=4217 RepID=A0ACB8XGZ5_ARCLA|nr:hypothetical protein L6452_41890 [Arctium lappa]
MVIERMGSKAAGSGYRKETNRIQTVRLEVLETSLDLFWGMVDRGSALCELRGRLEISGVIRDLIASCQVMGQTGYRTRGWTEIPTGQTVIERMGSEATGSGYRKGAKRIQTVRLEVLETSLDLWWGMIDRGSSL